MCFNYEENNLNSNQQKNLNENEFIQLFLNT